MSRPISFDTLNNVEIVARLEAAHSQAMPDRIQFPEGFDKGVLYQTVNRADIKQFREL